MEEAAAFDAAHSTPGNNAHLSRGVMLGAVQAVTIGRPGRACANG